MKWSRDPLRHEKYLLFDGIIQFCKKFDTTDLGNISISDLGDFVDDFFNSEQEEMNRIGEENDR